MAESHLRSVSTGELPKHRPAGFPGQKLLADGGVEDAGTGGQPQPPPEPGLPAEPGIRGSELNLAAMGLPSNPEEAARFLEEFKRKGGKIKCRVGAPIPTVKQECKTGSVVTL
jgi:hypothetical protein